MPDVVHGIEQQLEHHFGDGDQRVAHRKIAAVTVTFRRQRKPRRKAALLLIKLSAALTEQPVNATDVGPQLSCGESCNDPGTYPGSWV
jgi:hypothetical protein